MLLEPRRIKNGENKTNKKHHRLSTTTTTLKIDNPSSATTPQKKSTRTHRQPSVAVIRRLADGTHGLPTGASQDPIQKLMDYAPKCFIHFRYWTERRSYWFFFMICNSLSFFFNFSFLLPRSLTQHFKAYKWSHRHKRNGQLIWNPMETDITLLWRSRRSLDESPSFPQENVWKSNISTPFWRRWKIPQYFVL